MPTPEGLNTTTLHGLYVEPNATGTPLQGTLSFSPTPSFILFPTEDCIIAGTETATLDVNGEFTIELVSTDNAGSNPTGWLYTVTEKIIGQRQRTYNISLNYSSGVTIELADIQPSDDAPTYIPVIGPQGSPGIVTTVNGHSAATITLTAADVLAIPTSAINAASGVVGIGADGRVGIGITGPWAKFMVQSATDVVLAAFVQTNAAATQPGFLVQGAAGTWGAFGTSVAGDTQNRFQFTAGGNLTWGPGNANTDVGIYRSSAGNLNTTGQLSSDQTAPTLASHFTRKDYVDTADATAVKLTGNQTIAGTKTFSNAPIFSTGFSISGNSGLAITAAAGVAFRAQVTGDTVDRWAVTGDGILQFGTGAATRDTTLIRSGVAELTANGQLVVSTAAPTAIGHVTRKDYVDGNFVGLTTAQTISGVKTFSAAPIFQAAAAATVVSKFQVTGDANPRLTIGADGTLSFGPGTTAADLVVTRSGSAALGVNNTVRVTMGATTSIAYSTILTGDTFDRYRVYLDGKQEWGLGSVTRDTNLYRTGIGILTTDGDLNVGGALQFAAGPRKKTIVSTATTVANTTTETVIATMSIPAGDLAVGSAFRFKIHANLSFLASATITWKCRWGGVAGTNIGTVGATTLSSTAQTNKESMLEGYMQVRSIGTSGTGFANLVEYRNTQDTGSVGGGNGTVIANGGGVQLGSTDGVVTLDTSSATTFVVTAQWGAASASNTLTAYATMERLS